MLFHVGALWRLNEIGWLRRLSFLGLQPVLQRCATILVSDGGGHISYKARVASDWARHLRRVLVVVDNQVRWLRKSNLIDEYRRGTFRGAYWGVRADMSAYLLDAAKPVTDALDAPVAATSDPLRPWLQTARPITKRFNFTAIDGMS